MKIPRKYLLSLGAICLAFAASLLFTARVAASPAAPLEIMLTQPDGSTFSARQWGDEWNNGTETLDGYSIIRTPDGWWVYAELIPGGLLEPALLDNIPMQVGIDYPAGLVTHLRPTAQLSKLRAQDGVKSFSLVPGEYKLPPASGDMQVLVLLVKFEDIDETYTADTFEQLVFGATGSLKSYYQEVSYGNLNLVPAGENCGEADDGITAWTTLAYAHPNTGSSTGEDNLLITKDALIANDACIDYASFDANSDGGISADELQIIVVVAGWEAAYDDSGAPSIWAHSFYLDFVETPILDGVVLGSYYQQSYYAQIGEIHGTAADQHPATLGVLAHEFGHLLNWPDLYDIDGTSEGVGCWSIMGSGGWNQTGPYAGDTPAHPDAWLKWYQNWLEPIEIKGSVANVQIEQAEDHASAYLLRPNANGIDWIFNYHTGRGEYFLVENRQQVISDTGLPGCGLLIWHIQEQIPFNNFANANETLPLISLEQADGSDDLKIRNNRGDAGDPFPGDSGNLVFNLLSNPESRLWNGGVSGVSITVDAGACGPVMQADLTYRLVSSILLNIQTPDPSCSAWQTVMSEDFEDGTMDGWTATDENGTEYGEYYPAVSNCRAAEGTQSAWLISGGLDGSQLTCGAYYPDHAIPWMVYGPFSTLGESGMRLDFSHWTYIEPAIPFYIFDRHCVWASEDNHFFAGYCFTGDWNGWYRYSFSMKDSRGFFNFLNKPQVWVAFSMMSDDYIHFPEGGYVDDISLQKCTSPTGTSTQNTLQVTPSMIASATMQSIAGLFKWPIPYSNPTVIGPFFIWR
jgi:M6 family metalloprotease-like protein